MKRNNNNNNSNNKNSKIPRSDLKQNEDGTYVDNKETGRRGQRRHDDRPPLPKKILDDINKGIFYKNMPLANFFKALDNPAYRTRFVSQREEGAGKQRGVIYDILSLEELVYNLTACSTDIDCIKTLLTDRIMVKKNNYIDIYAALSKLLTNVLYNQSSPGSEATRRSMFINQLKTHPWYNLSVRGALIASKKFAMAEEANATLQVSRSNNKSMALRNIHLVDEYKYLTIIKRMLSDLEKEEPFTKDWFKISTNIIQASTGARWVESAFVSEFELSEIDKQFPKDVYIIVNKIAKQNAKALRKVQREYDKAIERGDEDPLQSLNFISKFENEQDMLEAMIPDKVIARPLPFVDLGITPEFIVNLSRDVRAYVISVVGQKPKEMTNEQYRTRISNELYQAPNNYFKKIWPSVDVLGFKGTTHAWRKLYVNYAFLLFGGGGAINLQAFIEDTLSHESIQTTFHYSTVNVKPAVRADDKAIRNEIASLKLELSELKKSFAQLKEKNIKEQQMDLTEDNDNKEENEIKEVAVRKPSTGEIVNIPVFKDGQMKGFRIHDKEKQKKVYMEAKHYIAAFLVYHYNMTEHDIRSIPQSTYRALNISENIYIDLKKNHPIPSPGVVKKGALDWQYIVFNEALHGEYGTNDRQDE